jgi:hypothetical protein
MRRFASASPTGLSQTTMILMAVLACIVGEARAEDQLGTLSLDATSFVSYSESQNPHIPAGSTIRFRFGAANADGSAPITVRPEDVAIAPIAVAQGMAIQYSLGGPATGTLRKVAGAKQIELFATLVATLQGSPETPPVSYELRFTTGTAQASNTSQTETVTVDGVPAAAANYVQLVGAATNRPDAFPGPGEAVYAVLSGSFDALPVLP